MRGHRQDIIWAYAVSLAKIASWIIVYGTLYRRIGAEAAALLALVRWTLGLLNYASAGLAPAIIHFAAKASGNEAIPPGTRLSGDADSVAMPEVVRVDPAARFSLQAVFGGGVRLSWAGAAIGAVLLMAWTVTEGRARQVGALVGLFGAGILIDVAADAWGAIIQARGRIRHDYQFQVLLEGIWTVLGTVGLFFGERLGISWQVVVGGSYCAGAVISAVLRGMAAYQIRMKLPGEIQPGEGAMVARRLLAFGGLVVLAQVAEFLYAPTDFQLIRWLIDLKTVAVYAPAVQLDAGIWLLISGLSIALLPMSARQFAQGNVGEIRRYYLQGTALTFSLLFIAAVAAYFGAPVIFKVWLGDRMRSTQAILPLVFVSTVIGGSAAVGRSILLATGQVRAFTVSVLVAGVLNVVISYCLVRYAQLGLKGIILGTMIVVIGRCGVWMPWYVIRTLRRLSQTNRGFDVIWPIRS